ncbi:hypothetical protein D3C86_1854590 [compost metagenome]
MRANQGINQICAGTDIQHRGLIWDRSITVFRQQIGEMMDVIRASRHRRTEKTFRNVPLRNAIKMGQKRLIQRLYRQRIGKIN